MNDSGAKVHFPNETGEYRTARNRLLKAEADLRTQIEDVAALRRALPPGGAVKEDYLFADASDGHDGEVTLSSLFAPGKDTLVLYSFMFAPGDDEPCPMCASMLDSLDGAARHITDRVNLAVVAKAPVGRLRAFAQARGWRHLRLLSSCDNTYNADYLGESPQGDQWPMLNIFVRRKGVIHHSWGTELFFVQNDGGHSRHVDMIWPLWNLFDLTAEGRGENWFPRHRYDD